MEELKQNLEKSLNHIEVARGYLNKAAQDKAMPESRATILMMKLNDAHKELLDILHEMEFFGS